MTGFLRTRQPPSMDRAAVSAAIHHFVAQEIIATANAARDPFGIDHDCLNPAGHRFIGSCGDVVYVHCAKVVCS